MDSIWLTLVLIVLIIAVAGLDIGLIIKMITFYFGIDFPPKRRNHNG